MDQKRRRAIIALFLVLSIGNFLRLDGQDQVRPIFICSILAIGLLSGILISDLAHLYKSRKEDKNRMV